MAILSDFDGGRSLHDTQHFALGQEVYDSQGNRWGYVQINEVPTAAADRGAHRLLRSTMHADIMSAGEGDVDGMIAAGSDRLIVPDTTNLDFTASTAGLLVGALGVIIAGDGRGQRFWIKRVVSDQEVVVEVLDNDTGKWDEQLTTDSKFYLWFPGMALRTSPTPADVTILDSFIEGVLHRELSEGDVGKFAYVQRSGLGLVTLDNDGNVLGQGKAIIPADAGLVQGLSAGTDATYTASEIQRAAQEAAAVIGKSLSDTSDTTNDVQVLAQLDIPAPGVSFAGARTNNSYNRVTIGSN